VALSKDAEKKLRGGWTNSPKAHSSSGGPPRMRPIKKKGTVVIGGLWLFCKAMQNLTTKSCRGDQVRKMFRAKEKRLKSRR